MTVQTHKIRVGDTLIPFKFQLKYLDEDTGLYTAYSLSGKSAYMVIEDEYGNSVTTGTGTSNECTITDAANGKGEYDFKEDDVDEAGLYYMYVEVYSGDEKASWPNEAKQLVLEIQ